MSGLRVLLASRALESDPNEGGFVLLRDLAEGLAAQDVVSVRFLSIATGKHRGIERVRAYVKPGWSRLNRVRFLMAILRHQKHCDVVHTAHMPTLLNAVCMHAVRAIGKLHGVHYVQTVTALPRRLSVMHTILLWGDVVTTLNSRLADVLAPHRPRVRTLQPVPNPERLKAMGGPEEAGSEADEMILLPFHFMHLPSGLDLTRVLQGLLSARSAARIVIAYRLTEEREAQRLKRSLGEPYFRRVTVLSAQASMLQLLRQVRLVIYPMADKVDKFNPPLLILEAIAMGVSVLASESVCLDEDLLRPGVVLISGSDDQHWTAQALSLLDGYVRRPFDMTSRFESYLDEVRHLYGSVGQSAE